MAKSKLKNDQFPSSQKLNKIHIVTSPFNKDPKNINFSQGGPNFGEGWPGSLGKMGINRDIYCYANQGVVNFGKAVQPLPPGTKILVIPQFSYMPDQILGKMKKSQNLTFLGSSPLKI